MNEDSPFEFEPFPLLPECSRQTLRLLAGDKEFYRASLASIGLPDRLFESEYARCSVEWAAEDTRGTITNLGRHMSEVNHLGVDLILSEN